MQMTLFRIFSLILMTSLFSVGQINAQVIYNGDFELNTGCNDALGQISMLENWFIVVESADFYSCGYTTGFFPTDGVADSGDAYTGFASYGDAIGSAESIGQQMPQPMTIGQEYNMSMALKTPTSGDYSDPCGGLCVYGFVGSPPTGVIANHTSLMVGAVELGCSGLVTNTVWENYTITFTATQAFDHIVVTTSLNIQCPQNIFIDNITFEEPEAETITVCAGEEVTLDPEFGVAVDWFEVVDDVNEFIQNSETYTFTPAEDTEIVAENIDDLFAYNILVNPLPVVNLGDDITVCPGDEVTLDAGLGWEEITWNGEVGDQTLLLIDEGTYEVEVTLNGCQGTDEVDVVFADVPDFTSLLVTNPGCTGQCNGQLALSLEPDWTYFLNGIASAEQAPDLCVGVYDLFITNGLCDNTMVLELTADPLPVIDLPLNYVICNGGEVTMTATSAEVDLVYNWDTGAVGETETLIPNEGDLYCVSATDQNGCSSIGHCTEIFFYPELALTGPEDVIPCPGEAINLQANAAGGEGTYVWQWTDENGLVLGADELLFYTADVPITLTVSLTDGCTSEGLSADVLVQTVVLPTPELVSTVETVCIPVPASFSLLNVEDFGAINWDFGDDTVGAGLEVNHTYETQGCYDISLGLIHNEGCPLNLVFEDVLCAFDLPMADFSIREGTIVYNSVDEIHFDNTSEGAIDYIWTLNGDEVSNEESAVIEGWEIPGVYEVCLEAINEHGCSDLLCTEIIVKLPPNVFIPNAFTPDLDGINEVFKPVMNFEPNEYTFEIFDRWGELIFISTDPDLGWIGNVKNGGHYVQTEVYTYQVTVVMPDTGNAKLYEGLVTVLR
jgi:gliding motility-associated-like protein